MARKIIIDTDPGIDDAMAIFYALNSPELDVIGLTTVFGNCATPLSTVNALRLLEIAGRQDIPVAAGAERPLATPFQGAADYVHGANGQGNIVLPKPRKTPEPTHAALFLIEQIRKAPGEVTIVALAPLTNLALAFLLDPELPRYIQEIVLMGGNAFVPGNATPTAEANIWNDPEAANLVFGVECPITMVGLDVTEKIVMEGPVLDQIINFENPRAQHLARILPFYRRFYQGVLGVDVIYVHDSTTITYMLYPHLFTTVQHPIVVETTGISRGKTWPAIGSTVGETVWKGRPPINICVSVDAAEAVRLEMLRLAGSL